MSSRPVHRKATLEGGDAKQDFRASFMQLSQRFSVHDQMKFSRDLIDSALTEKRQSLSTTSSSSSSSSSYDDSCYGSRPSSESPQVSRQSEQLYSSRSSESSCEPVSMSQTASSSREFKRKKQVISVHKSAESYEKSFLKKLRKDPSIIKQLLISYVHALLNSKQLSWGQKMQTFLRQWQPISESIQACTAMPKVAPTNSDGVISLLESKRASLATPHRLHQLDQLIEQSRLLITGFRDTIVQEILTQYDAVFSTATTPEKATRYTILAVENALFEHVSQDVIRVYRERYAADDLAHAVMIRELILIMPPHLGIKPLMWLLDASPMRVQSFYPPYHNAIQELKTMSEWKTPFEKAACLKRTGRQIYKCVTDHHFRLNPNISADQLVVGADELLPLVSYLILKSNVPYIYSDQIFMMDFSHDSITMGESGYMMVTFNTCLSFLLCLKLEEAETIANDLLNSIRGSSPFAQHTQSGPPQPPSRPPSQRPTPPQSPKHSPHSPSSSSIPSPMPRASSHQPAPWSPSMASSASASAIERRDTARGSSIPNSLGPRPTPPQRESVAKVPVHSQSEERSSTVVLNGKDIYDPVTGLKLTFTASNKRATSQPELVVRRRTHRTDTVSLEPNTNFE